MHIGKLQCRQRWKGATVSSTRQESANSVCAIIKSVTNTLLLRQLKTLTPLLQGTGCCLRKWRHPPEPVLECICRGREWQLIHVFNCPCNTQRKEPFCLRFAGLCWPSAAQKGLMCFVIRILRWPQVEALHFIDLNQNSKVTGRYALEPLASPVFWNPSKFRCWCLLRWVRFRKTPA